MLMVNQLAGFGVSEDSEFSLAFVTSAENAANLTTYTFSAQSFGVAHANRVVIIGLVGRSGGGTSISSVTIGGVTATAIVGAINSGGGDSTHAALYAAAVPTGATGDVVIVFSAGNLRCGIGIWRMIKASGVTAFDTGTSTADDPSTTLDIPAGGAAVAIAHSVGASPTTTWTGLTERFDTLIEATAHTGADASFATEQIGLSVQATFTVDLLDAFATASWR